MPCPSAVRSVCAPRRVAFYAPRLWHGETAAWGLYNQMIAGIPEGVLVRDYCLGLNWSYVEADCGMGVAFTVRGGGKRTYKMDLRGMELRQVAELSKSWCFQEAALVMASLKTE